jgi:hypothetical protein
VRCALRAHELKPIDGVKKPLQTAGFAKLKHSKRVFPLMRKDLRLRRVVGFIHLPVFLGVARILTHLALCLLSDCTGMQCR